MPVSIYGDGSISGVSTLSTQLGVVTATTFSGDLTGNVTGQVTVATGSTISGGNNYITASTNGSERVRIDSSGNFGIGTTSVATKLTLGQDSDTDGSNVIRIYRGGSSGQYSEVSNTSSHTNLNTVGGGGITLNIGGSEKARLDSSGRLLVGTSGARSNFYNGTYTPPFQVESADSSSGRGLAIVNNTSSDGSTTLIIAKSNGTTTGSNTSVASGNHIGNISFQGNDGSEFVEAAKIDCYVDGTPGANDMPGRLVFSTTADGASSPTERMRIQSNGYISTPDNSSAASGLQIGYQKLQVITGSFSANNWYDTGIDRTTDTGIFEVDLLVDTWNAGGQSYSMRYTGWFVMHSGSTNSTDVSNIDMHRTGHAPNSETIQLRTILGTAGSGGNIRLQWLSNFNLTLDNSGGKLLRIALRRFSATL